MKILAVDTSSVAATAAIIEDNLVVAEYFLNTKLNHSQTIMEMIKSLVTQSGISLLDIDAFACAVGPGSFTGLRIGIAAIKGMADGLDKPCIPVSTLEGLAENLKGFNGLICPVMDARCNQVYTALFDQNGNRLWQDDALTIDDLGEKLKEYNSKIYFVGDGANICINNLKNIVADIEICSPTLMYSRGSSIAIVAQKLFAEGKSILGGELTPIYLRLPQAERELKKKQEV